MKSSLRGIVSITLLVQPLAQARDVVCEKKQMIVVSFDGMGSDVLEKAIQNGKAPELARWRAKGMSAPNAHATTPIKTLPNHASMVSGIEDHGVEKNTKPILGMGGQGAIKVKTTFEIAQETEGLVTALVTSKPKLENMLNKKRGAGDDQVATIQHAKVLAGKPGTAVMAEAIRTIDRVKPQLMMIHMGDVDVAGHHHGWLSDKQMAAVQETDRAFGLLMRHLETRTTEPSLNCTTVLVTADHGGPAGDKDHGVKSDKSHEDGRIPWFAIGHGVPAGTTLDVPVRSYHTATFSLQMLGLRIPDHFTANRPLVLPAPASAAVAIQTPSVQEGSE